MTTPSPTYVLRGRALYFAERAATATDTPPPNQADTPARFRWRMRQLGSDHPVESDKTQQAWQQLTGSRAIRMDDVTNGHQRALAGPYLASAAPRAVSSCRSGGSPPRHQRATRCHQDHEVLPTSPYPSGHQANIGRSTRLEKAGETKEPLVRGNKGRVCRQGLAHGLSCRPHRCLRYPRLGP